MKYNTTNVEIMLLQLINEADGISGYEINKVVKQRGYREWADIGTTSIYNGLKKLSNRKLIHSVIDENKTGKGPLPFNYYITEDGKQILKEDILKTLSITRERDKRFDLAFGGSAFLSSDDVICALEKRVSFLLSEKERITNIYRSQFSDYLPLQVKMLFEHPIFLIDNEIAFTKRIIVSLKNARS